MIFDNVDSLLRNMKMCLMKLMILGDSALIAYKPKGNFDSSSIWGKCIPKVLGSFLFCFVFQGEMLHYYSQISMCLLVKLRAAHYKFGEP